MATFTDETSLLTLLPATYRESDVDGSLQAFFVAVDNVWSSMVTSMEDFDNSVLTPDTSMLDNWLAHRGNPFTFTMTDDQKRLLVDGLFRIYKLRGSKDGMLKTINYILGLDCALQYDFEYCWRLGVSRLGVDTILMSNEKPMARLFVAGQLSDDTLYAVQTIVDFMKPHWLDIRVIGGAIISPSIIMVNLVYPARVIPVAGANSYTWAITNGAILSGQGTTNITFSTDTPGLVTLQLTVQTSMGSTVSTAFCTAYASMASLTLVTDEYQYAGQMGITARVEGNYYKLKWTGTNIDIESDDTQNEVQFNVGVKDESTRIIATATDASGASAVLKQDIKVVPYTSTVMVSTRLLGPNDSQNLEVDLGWGYDLVAITSSSPSWVRVYNSATDRAMDAARKITEDPDSNSPMVWEGIFTPDLLIIPDAPEVSGDNGDHPQTKTAYIAIQNLSTNSTSVTITVTRTETRVSGNS